MTLRARRTDTGEEFDLHADCFAHGANSRRIGLPDTDNPFSPASADKQISWRCGWEYANGMEARKGRASSEDVTP